jgi:hypothetical protein
MKFSIRRVLSVLLGLLSVFMGLLTLLGLFIIIPSHENRDGMSYRPSWDLVTDFPRERSIDYKRQVIQTLILGTVAYFCFSTAKQNFSAAKKKS